MKDRSRDRPQFVGVSRNRTEANEGTVTVRIDALAAGGRGVGRVDGKVWFVRAGLPGDTVRAVALRSRRSHVDAAAVEILSPSSARREPPCPHAHRCGGCPLMPLRDDAQRELKVGLLREALERIARLPLPAIEAVRCPSPPLGYRNRVEFAARGGGSRSALVGLHGAGGAELVDIERCLLQDDAANAVLRSTREFLSSRRVGEGPAFALRLGIRRGPASGELLVTLREAGPRSFRDGPALARFLSERHDRLVGVVELRAPSAGRGGVRTHVLAGRDWLEERSGALRVELPAASFAQVSEEGAAELVRLVGEMAGPHPLGSVVDLYGGLGLFGMELARAGAERVTVCDADADAVEAGRRIAAAAGMGRVHHIHADAAAFVASAELGRPDVVVANPPRGGLAREVVRALGELAPRLLILVSCDAATLARDLGRLARGGTYRVERIVPVDLFPQTAHLEAVVRLAR